MSNMSLNDIITQIEKICKHFEVEHLYLFGSYATGTATSTSDIDIIIKGGKDILSLKECIASIKTLKKIDIFEYEKCNNQFLKEDMELYGKQIY